MRLLPALILVLLSVPSYATVQSETIFFLQPDGNSYLIERSIHSSSPTHRFHLDKRIRLRDIRHISPARFEWDDADPEVNSLSFDAGGFTLIYPDRFDATEVRQDRDGVFHYKSWNGTPNQQGRYGYWYAPGQFDQFTYTWILPENIELRRYRSNQQGTWTRRDRAISFYAEKVNNLTFEISYRVTPSQGPKTASATSQPSPTPARQAVAEPPQPPLPAGPSLVSGGYFRSDSDGDSVIDSQDLCAQTPPGAAVDQVGCPLDTDRDGVPDGLDACLATPEQTPVGANGCIAER